MRVEGAQNGKGVGALGFWYHLQFLRPWVYPFLFLGLSLPSSEMEEGIC